MSHEQRPVRLTTEIGTGLVAAGALGYLLYRKHHQEQLRAELPALARYREQLAIFDNEKVDRVLPQGRQLMAAAAVRIIHATLTEQEGIITKDKLYDMFAAAPDDTLHVPGYKLQTALSYLRDNELISRAGQQSNPKARGYYATAPLVWAFENDELPPVVAEAQTAFVQTLSDNS